MNWNRLMNVAWELRKRLMNQRRWEIWLGWYL